MLPGGGRPPTPPQLTNGGKPSWYVLTSLACLFEPPPYTPNALSLGIFILLLFISHISLFSIFQTITSKYKMHLMTQEEKKIIEENIIALLKTCYDPEIPVDIYELGLIYDIDIDDEKNVNILMTLTTPMCPVAESLPAEVEAKIKQIPQVKSVKVTITFDPPWTPQMMSEHAKAILGFD